MTLDDVNALLKSTGLPVTYRAWPDGEVPPLPFICYLSPETDAFMADAQVYLTTMHVNIVLYTKLKDQIAEGKVEAALSSIHWHKTETYIDTEKCYQILYEIEV